MAVAAVFAGVTMVAPVSVQASTGGWGVVPFPASPAYYQGDNTITVGADALGNIYYVPAGTCSNPNLMARPNVARVAHVVHALANVNINSGYSGVGCGIEQYNPNSGAMLQLAPTMDFQSALDVAVDPAGNVFVLNSDGTIYEISGGVAFTFESLAQAPMFEITYNCSQNYFICGAQGLAVNASDQVFVTVDSPNGTVYEVASTGATPVSLATVNDYLSSIAVAPDGTIYTTSYNGMSKVYQLAPGGSLVSIGTGWSQPETVTVDAAGNAYVADEGNGVVTEITPAGVQSNLPVDPAGVGSNPDEIMYGGGTVYLWDESAPNPNVLYSWGAGAAHATNLSATSTAIAVNGRETQSITATWTGGTASSYRCTLLYGYNDPTSFTVLTSTPSCTFSNLALGVGWGVSVVALSNGVASAPSVVFTPAATFTITCVYQGHVLHRTGTDPRCPTRWRQRL